MRIDPKNVLTTWLPLFLILGTLLGCQVVRRSLRYNKPGITDYRLWEANRIDNADEVSPFQYSDRPELAAPAKWAHGRWLKKDMTTEEFLRHTGTAAFIVFRDDTIRY